MVLFPYGCEIVFPECDYTDIVSPEILENFIIEIDQRRKPKLEKDSRQERARIKVESWDKENRCALVKLGKELLADDYEQSLPTTMANQSIKETELYGGASSSAMESASRPLGTDFHSEEESSGAGLASSSTSPAQRRSVWGTPLVHFLEETEPATYIPASDDNGGWLLYWEQDLIRQEQRLVGLELAGSIASGGGQVSSQGKGAQGGKKKFKKLH